METGSRSGVNWDLKNKDNESGVVGTSEETDGVEVRDRPSLGRHLPGFNTVLVPVSSSTSPSLPSLQSGVLECLPGVETPVLGGGSTGRVRLRERSRDANMLERGGTRRRRWSTGKVEGKTGSPTVLPVMSDLT